LHDRAPGAWHVVPCDLAVAGIDDIDMSSHRAPSLTTVHVRCMGIGTEAALKLIGLIEKGSPPMILDLPV
jgi:LacI family gluconate utilization system Gnt-I transcriptional repressor